MPFKLNISDKGKAWKIELQDESLVGKSVGDKIEGKEIKPELDGYELEITGGTDLSGFPLSKDVEGIGLKKVLLTKGWGMKDNRQGVRIRKTLRGKQISLTASQINMKVIKSGAKKLDEVFPEQNKAKDAKSETADASEAKAAE